MKYLLFLLSLTFSTEINVNPSFYTKLYSSGGEYNSENINISFLGWEVNSNLKSNNFQINSSFSAHGIKGYIPHYTDLNQTQVVPYLYNYMDNYPNLGIYWTSHVNLKYKKNNLIIEAGNQKRKIGFGINSIFISNKPPNYPTIGFDWQITPSINYNYFYAFLNQLNNDVGNYRIYSYKSMAVHQLVYNISDKFMLSMYESVIFDRYMDINYLNPFILYYPLSRYMGYDDNNQIGLELIFNLNQYQRYQFSLLVDEWDPDLTFGEYHENWFAYQLGSQFSYIFTQNDKLSIEYTWTDFRVYENTYEDVDFYLEGNSIGFWAGSHSKSFFLDYSFNYNKYFINLNYVNVKRGFQPENLIEIAYEKINFDRYSLGYEQKVKYTFKLGYQLNQLIDFGFSLNYLDWIMDSNLDSNIYGRMYFGLDLKYNFKQINI